MRTLMITCVALLIASAFHDTMGADRTGGNFSIATSFDDAGDVLKMGRE